MRYCLQSLPEKGSRRKHPARDDIDVHVSITHVSLKRNVPTIQSRSFIFEIIKNIHCVKASYNKT